MSALVPGGGAVLDIGCAPTKGAGAVGLDISPETDADIVHDLDEFPYPLEDHSFDQVVMQDVLEHVSQPVKVLDEVHPVLTPGRRLLLPTPHFSSLLAYSAPTHAHYFSTLA